MTRRTVVELDNGACYVETVTDGEVYTDGPYGLPVAHYLAGPDASVQHAAPWTDTAQRCAWGDE